VRPLVLWISIGIVILIIFVPPAIRSIWPKVQRTLRGPALSTLDHVSIAFESADGLELGGMLFLPESRDPVPAVVMIHGSGPSTRDNPWYLTFVQALVENGIAVLLPDKRGSEASGGDWRTASFSDFTADAKGAIEFLLSEHGSSISSVGVMGLSQGGQVAPLVAADSTEVAFVINVVGSVVPFREALYYEENKNIRALGVVPGVSHAIALVSSWHIRTFRQPEFWSRVADYDALSHWARVSQPALVLLGENDQNTPSRRSARRLRSLGMSNISVEVYPGSGHALEPPDGNAYVRREVLDRIVSFINTES
jgi:dipeptidyl aminopeptidase/acylaminoacyl peptidase